MSEDALKALKKLIASGGDLQGNFYFAGDSRGDEAGIVVTLTARDPDGAKAANSGKKLRQEIAKAKFARGVIRGQGSKLLFELHSGNATKDHMKLGFKNAFKDDELKALKRLLRRAIFKAAGEEVEEPLETPNDDATPVPDVVLTDEDNAGLDELRELQGGLAERNEVLLATFLSVEQAQEDTNELLAQALTELVALAEKNPDDPAIQEKRYDLAEKLYAGPDPFPEVGKPLPREIAEIVKVPVNNALEMFKARMEASANAILERRRELDSVAAHEVVEFGGKAEVDLKPHLAALNNIMGQIRNFVPR